MGILQSAHLAACMRWLKRIMATLLVIIVLLVAGSAIAFYVAMKPYLQLASSWVFKENQNGPVIGDLGGIPVSIPQPIARFVEYQDDPHFLDPRKGPKPTRTYQSKLRSFGFEVRFPDMVPLTEATREDKSKSNIYNTMWLGVGVHVASYHDELSLKRLVDAIPAPGKIWVNDSVNPPHVWKEKHGYLRSPDLLHGLVVHEVQGYDEAERFKVPSNNGMGDYNIYYHTNNKGKIDAYIKCNNIKHDAAPCSHHFILPAAKNTMIKIHYRIGLLPQWREIQDSVGKAILGFSAMPRVENSNSHLTSNQR